MRFGLQGLQAQGASLLLQARGRATAGTPTAAAHFRVCEAAGIGRTRHHSQGSGTNESCEHGHPGQHPLPEVSAERLCIL